MKIPWNFYKTIIKAKRVTNRVLPAASERRLHYFSDCHFTKTTFDCDFCSRGKGP